MFLGALLLWMSTVAYKRGYCAGCCRALAPALKRLPRTLQPAAAAAATPTSTGALNAPADRYRELHRRRLPAAAGAADWRVTN